MRSQRMTTYQVTDRLHEGRTVAYPLMGSSARYRHG